MLKLRNTTIHCLYVSELSNSAQRSYGCHTSGSVQGQIGLGPEQPDLVKSVIDMVEGLELYDI